MIAEKMLNKLGYKMTAEKMFDKLGYKRVAKNATDIISYLKVKDMGYDSEDSIVFDLEEKTVGFYATRFDESTYMDVDLKLLKVILKQLEELGWR